jgi:hypothetical protein
MAHVSSPTQFLEIFEQLHLLCVQPKAGARLPDLPIFPAKPTSSNAVASGMPHCSMSDQNALLAEARLGARDGPGDSG